VRGPGKPTKHYGRWRIRWTDASRRRQSAVFDTYREAEQALRLQQVAAADGERRGPGKAHSFDELCQQWLSVRALHKRSRKNDESMIRAHLRPAFGGRRLEKITVERIDAFAATLARAPNTVHHILSLLSAMLRYAHELEWLTRPPKVRKPKLRLLGRNFRFLRTDDEIRRFLRAARDEGELVAALYTAAVYTGMRAGELAGLRWDDVDFDGRLICVQRSYDGPTKSGDLRWVPTRSAAAGPAYVAPAHRRRKSLPDARRPHARPELAHFPGDASPRARARGPPAQAHHLPRPAPHLREPLRDARWRSLQAAKDPRP
jgi:integrase